MSATLPSFGTERITQLGLRDRVYDRVLEVLMGHDVEPGMRLSIDGLARSLGCPRRRCAKPWCNSNGRAS